MDVPPGGSVGHDDGGQGHTGHELIEAWLFQLNSCLFDPSGGQDAFISLDTAKVFVNSSRKRRQGWQKGFYYPVLCPGYNDAAPSRTVFLVAMVPPCPTGVGCLR